jgi:hypothetical protein
MKSKPHRDPYGQAATLPLVTFFSFISSTMESQIGETITGVDRIREG